MQFAKLLKFVIFVLFLVVTIAFTGCEGIVPSITPDSGYQIEDALVDGSSVGAVSIYPFINVTEDQTIYPTFRAVADLVHNLTKDTYYNTIQASLEERIMIILLKLLMVPITKVSPFLLARRSSYKV